MSTDADITATFWTRLRADRTVMLGMEFSAPTTLRPMTAQLDGDDDAGPFWFFTATDSALWQGRKAEGMAIFTFASISHDIFATVHGHMTPSTDRTTLDRLWSPLVAAWQGGGREDPALALMRFDPARAEIWHSGSGLLAGLKLLFGGDPAGDFKDNAAQVSLA